MSDAQRELGKWDQQIYDLLDAGVSLDDIEETVAITIQAIREERGDDE